MPKRKVVVKILAMNQIKPTREEASAAITEVGVRASQVRTADVQLGWVLGVLLAADLAIAALMSVAPHTVGPAVLALLLIAFALAVVVFVRIRAYSRAGLLIFSFTASTFAIWSALGSALSVVTGWWGPSQPSFHLGVTEAIPALPLLVGIWLLGRRRS